MKCKLSEKCEFGNLCKDATRHDSLTVLGCSSFKTKKPMTEQEWLQTCNTEQLAKVLLSFCQYPCEICKVQCDDGNACTYNKALNTIVEWLKQPHNS